jgi:hypothetical protein
LYKERALFRVHTDREPVQKVSLDIMLKIFCLSQMVSQELIVGDDKEAVILALMPDTVL